MGLASRTRLGARHNLRPHPRPATLYPAAAAGLPALADPGYDGAGIGIHVPVKQPADGRTLISIPVPATRCCAPFAAWENAGFALVTGRWRTLQHITASPGKIGDIARAALVLTHFEYGYIK